MKDAIIGMSQGAASLLTGKKLEIGEEFVCKGVTYRVTDVNAIGNGVINERNDILRRSSLGKNVLDSQPTERDSRGFAGLGHGWDGKK